MVNHCQYIFSSHRCHIELTQQPNHPGTRVETHCTTFYSTSCVPCDNGTYMDELSEWTECLQCRFCNTDCGLREKAPCSSISNTVCEPEEGHYCLRNWLKDGSCGAARKHRSCLPGQYIKLPGTSSSDTECEDCPEGYFSPAGFTCIAWTVCPEAHLEVRPGTKQEDVVCGGGATSRSHFILSIPFVGVAFILVPG
ncbi:hypothetical protein WMY93_027058 [Mugilogobius chulae]|uniref:TNFR-Cys domain-containing protein n=1 Tax=Mugilogobius chulae TaxID=88201 RepID=A0AAW0MW01_9GOBI